MAIGNAVKGAVHTAQTIIWKDSAGAGWDLSLGTLSGKMKKQLFGASSRNIVGALAFVTTGADGKFTWTYDAATDIPAAGLFKVQFKCTYGDGTFDLTKITSFEVLDAL